MVKQLPRSNFTTTTSTVGSPWRRLAGAIVIQAFKDAVGKSSCRGLARWWLMYDDGLAALLFDALDLDQAKVSDVLSEYSQGLG